MNRLYKIKIHPEDQVRGNYLLLLSGPVTHAPGGRYLVAESQIRILEKANVKYSKV